MNIVITGASRGIGAETALKFAETGKHQLILISRNRSKLEELEAKITLLNTGCNCLLIPVDLATESELLRACTEISKHYPVIDILLNNAGFLVNKPFESFSTNEIYQMFMVNCLVPAMIIRELMPLLRKSEIGHVLNIGSMGGFQGSAKFPGLSYYSASKAGLAILTECLAEELKETGVKFNCLALGSADTEMLREAFPGYTPPLTAKEMSAFISSFALTGHRYFNGKVLPVSLTSP